MFACVDCLETLPVERFRVRPERNNWRNTKCRKCERAVQVRNYYDLKASDPFTWKIRILKNCRSRDITREWIEATLTRQDYRCAVSGRSISKLDFEVDHIIPRAKGGSNELGNLQLVSRAANSAKSDLSNDELVRLCVDIVRTLRPELIGRAILEAEKERLK